MKIKHVLRTYAMGIFFLLASVQQANAGFIWAETTNVAVPGFGWLHHTYTCVGNSSNCYTFPATSATSGGTFVTYGTATTAQEEEAEFYGQCCKHPQTMYYGVDGVCHQHTNIMLDSVGAEINTGVFGYGTSKWIYGRLGSCTCYYNP